VRQPRSASEEADDDYEQKSVTNIKAMFNKPDETFPQGGGPRIRRAHPKAPMYRPHEESSFSTPHYGPTASAAPKSSLTPSRPGAIQRGASDVRPSSYVPLPLPAQDSKAVRLYGQEDRGPRPKYTGGFAGVNALIKPIQPTAPVKRPPGQKKKDFDPNQSSVLRVLHEEEQRSKSAPRGQDQYEEEPRGHPQQRSQQPSRGQQPQQRDSTGQQWQQQQAVKQPSGPPKQQTSASLQALLERDQQNNPQEDPDHNRRAPAPQPHPGQGEYRRPGTSFKPSENKPTTQVNLDEEYPLPAAYTEKYNYPTANAQYSGKPTSSGISQSYHQSAGNTQSYQSAGNTQSYQSAGNTQSYQTPGDYPTYQSTASFQSAGNYPAAGKYEAQGYPASKYTGSGYPIGGGTYPMTNYGAEGIPVSDF